MSASALQTPLPSGDIYDYRVAKQGFNTTHGPTGMINVPTAFVAPTEEFNLGTTLTEGKTTVTGNYGVIEGIEIGGAYVDRDGLDNKFFANAKVHIVPQNFKYFELGVGVIDAVDAINRTYYAVGSVNFTPGSSIREHGGVGLRGHAGVGTGIFQDRFIGGAEVIFNDKLALIGEYDSEDFNAVFRYSHDDTLRLQLGFANTDFTFGVTYGLKF